MITKMMNELHNDCLAMMMNSKSEHEQSSLMVIAERIEEVQRFINSPVLISNRDTPPPPADYSQTVLKEFDEMMKSSKKLNMNTELPEQNAKTH
jgi:uncharacterized protein (UPF0276 family)